MNTDMNAVNTSFMSPTLKIIFSESNLNWAQLDVINVKSAAFSFL